MRGMKDHQGNAIATRPYAPARLPLEEALARASSDLAHYATRRSVRHFSSDPVPRELVEAAIRIAGTAPSGAHRQPWHFVAICDPALKRRIREAAEAEERDFYERRAPPEWLEALAPLGTDFVKEHITAAPWVVIVFRRDRDILPAQGSAPPVVLKNYYVAESVGIALGFFISALHRFGLATLPHTPAPMTFLRELCGRPEHEKPFVLMPVGYPAADCRVPDLSRKTLEEISQFME